jgi:purine-cytosine permease-like protein
MFFAWFCNMAMHIGMSDLSVFRFAKKSWYGIASSSGMFLGHFMAWIAASILYALQMHLDAANTDVSPGPMTNRACGVAGLICVIVAGWTTANPTIYRAGLAFQSVVPRLSTFTVTLATGVLATIAGMFPVVAMKLLGFVALYGLLLMPMGAIIFVDFWLMPKFGLRDRFAERTGVDFNWAAALAWVLTLAICGGIAYVRPDLLYFVSLPGWFLAAITYVVASRVMQSDAQSQAAKGVST